MRIEELVGQNVARYRACAELTQAQLGEHLARYLGRPWPRQTVSQAEHGERSFTAADVASLAAVLKVSVLDLFLPENPARSPEIAISPDSTPLHAGLYSAAIAGGGAISLDHMTSATMLSSATRKLRDATADAMQAVESVSNMVDTWKMLGEQAEQQPAGQGDGEPGGDEPLKDLGQEPSKRRKSRA